MQCWVIYLGIKVIEFLYSLLNKNCNGLLKSITYVILKKVHILSIVTRQAAVEEIQYRYNLKKNNNTYNNNNYIYI